MEKIGSAPSGKGKLIYITLVYYNYKICLILAGTKTGVKPDPVIQKLLSSDSKAALLTHFILFKTEMPIQYKWCFNEQLAYTLELFNY